MHNIQPIIENQSFTERKKFKYNFKREYIAYGTKNFLPSFVASANENGIESPYNPGKGCLDCLRIDDRIFRIASEKRRFLKKQSDRKKFTYTTIKQELPECPNKIKVVQSVKHKRSGQAYVKEFALPCRMKRCPHCGEKLKRKMIYHYTSQFEKDNHLKFITFTVDFKKLGIPKEDSRKYLVYVWSLFRKRINRELESYGMKFKYLAVPEQHKSGLFHLHVICVLPIPEKAIREHWFHCKGGIVVDVQDFNTGKPVKVIGYLVKYMTKTIRENGQTVRTYMASKGMSMYADKKENETDQEYRVFENDYQVINQILIQRQKIPQEIQEANQKRKRQERTDMLKRFESYRQNDLTTKYRFRTKKGVWYQVTMTKSGDINKTKLGIYNSEKRIFEN